MFIEMKVAGLTIDPFTNAPIMILRDLEDKKTLPIWIGILEASAIASELEKLKFSRPMTHDLIKNIFEEMEIKVKRVEVTDLKDNVYYATIHLEKGDTTYQIDARPSDAIAIALRTGSPIFVENSILEKSKSIDLSADKDKKEGAQNLLELLDELGPEAFGKYKM
ncbi:MAG TPA: bifunctional nuclease family protein [Deltaproteobacteria bacterium]|nr:bifunctional nuclease family protein [Deltaproteobacteria bacterium]